MRIAILAIVSTLALAGCSDPPPSGDLASTGHALVAAGSITTFAEQEFASPHPDQVPPELQGEEPCPVDHIPPQSQDPVEQYRCDRPYTAFTVNFTDLPDPLAMTYALEFYSTTSLTSEAIREVSGHVHPTTGKYMADDFTFDNSAECAQETSNEGCVKSETFDTVRLLLGDIVVAHAPLAANSAFVLDAGLMGVSFQAEYEGKDLTLTVSGLNPNYTYEGWLISVDEAGAAVHDQKFTVTEGANEFAAPMNINKYTGVHIHVADTKLNVAVGALA